MLIIQFTAATLGVAYMTRKLLSIMYEKHRLEYERIYKETTYLLFVILLYSCIQIVTLLSSLIKVYLKTTMTRNENIVSIKSECDLNSITDLVFLISCEITNFQDYTMIFHIAFAWIIIKIKSDQDIIQGLNKLDELVKVSCF